MSSQESRRLWFFLKDNSKLRCVYDIPIDANVDLLKSAIKKRFRCLHDTDTDFLKLWKLDVLVPIGPDNSLAQRLEAMGNLTMYSHELSSEEEVGELFPKPPSQKHLHIMVQPLEILSLNVPSFSVSRKRLRSPAGEDGRASKRKEIEKVSKGILDIQTRSVEIHETIKALNDLNLSNPLTFTSLPFPSLLPMPSQRFEKKTTNGIKHFTYMGRSHFDELQKRVKNENFLDGSQSLYLYGTSGSGKSHLLAALVCHLIRQQKRVIYIPDCSTLYLEPAETILTALIFAFYDLDLLGTIGDPHSVDELTDFMSKHQDLYIIVDQVNALESTKEDNHREKKIMIRAWLDRLRLHHRYIFSASANEISNQEADKKQSGISVFRIFGGMNENETDQWFIRHGHQIPRLSAEQRQRVEYLTGCIPLLLRCLINITDFVELEFRNIPDLRIVAFDVEKFFRNQFESLSPLSMERYLTIMRQCVQGEFVTFDDRNLYDLRYFYVDEGATGHSTCGIAFEVMLSLLQTYDNTSFLDDLWYAAVSRSKNPVVQGFLAEKICLSTIANHGLKAVHPQLGRMSTATFETQPAFNTFLSTDHNVRLYIPISYNFRAVDGVILLLDRASNQATMFSIQFTLSQNHKQSDKEFHTKLWPSWIEPIIAAGFRVRSTFVWINKKQPSEHVEPELVKALRSGDKIVHPEYSVVHVGVEMVDSRLASVLGIKQ